LKFAPNFSLGNMKKIFFLILYYSVIIFLPCLTLVTISERVNLQTMNQQECLDGNNIKAYFQTSGTFDKNISYTNHPGFEWPKGSNKYAIFTAGLTIAGFLNNNFCMASASYCGEYSPGYCINGISFTNTTFKFYKVKKGDNYYNSQDWRDWGLMVTYGAPFTDVDKNGIYEPLIDTPGFRNAAQTLFLCITDGFTFTHTSGEGFGGGTTPMFAEIHLTAWCYDNPGLEDVQFVRWKIINKSIYRWDSTIFSVVCDPDLGGFDDDYIGVDTIRRLAYCYNADDYDRVYGNAPPAVGMVLLKGAVTCPELKSGNPGKNIFNPDIESGMKSFVQFKGTGSNSPICETDPNGEPYPAYLFMSGFKKDSTCWLNPYVTTGTRKTKFLYPGNPYTGEQWTEYGGSIGNCGRDTTGNLIIPNTPIDRRFLFSTGKVKVNTGETQTVIIAQLIRRGTSNTHSVQRLKEYSDSIITFYRNEIEPYDNGNVVIIPSKFLLYQNYPNPFNPETTIEFDVPETKNIKITIYDIRGREMVTLVNSKYSPGKYTVAWFASSDYSSGIYFYKMTAGDYTETRRMVLLK